MAKTSHRLLCLRLFLSSGLALANGNLNAADPWLIGSATNSEDGTLLYQEWHFRSDNDVLLSERVEYRTPTGALLVQKTLAAGDSLWTPSVEQSDLRTGTRFFVRNLDDSITAGYQRGASNLKTDRLKKTEDLVIDAGFDPYVRNHWQALQGGETVQAQFYVPAQMDTVKISIRATDPAQCADLEEQSLCLVVRPAGILRVLGWFVDPLYLAYAQDSQRLLMYRGISNLLDDDGQSQNVLIRYQYLDQAS